MIRTTLIAMLSTVGVSAGPAQDPTPARAGPPAAVRTPSVDGPDLSLIRFSLEDRSDGRAQLALSFGAGGREGRRSNMSGPWDWADLRGVDRDVLARAEGPVAFVLDAAAGDLSCAGVASSGMAAGRCDFDPDEAFAASLERRVGARPTEGQLFHLALTDFDPALLDALERHGYGRPTLDQIVAAAIHDVDAAYVASIADAGYRLGSLDDLVGFRIHGVTADYVADMARLGPRFRDLPAEVIMGLAIHDVTPDYVRTMAGLGLGGDADDMTALKIHGVTAEGVGALAASGYGDLTAEQHLAFAIHDVDAAFIREMAAEGYADLSADSLLALRIHGVTPDYARRMAREGIRERAGSDAD